MIQKDKNRKDHSAWTIGNGDPMQYAQGVSHILYLTHGNNKGKGRGRNRHKNNEGE